MKTERETIAKQLLNLMTEFNERDAQSRRFGTDTLLYHSEIHLLAFLKDHPDFHPAEIARSLSLTRGAVSQTLARLEAKGFIRKRQDPECCRCVLLSLTEKGLTACGNHEEQHRRYEQLIAGILENEDEPRLDFLQGFLEQLRKNLL
ncbi:MarR family protein [Caprobacter fermentans]|uniref:MarR family protein n=1 Tax=Caproicibacter fermentans TaxID=2576756 RepID=A0A6N8I236_9FIRM|nr:MarR family transcriptional regulator [Caproicibacter fermentans]MVB12171.1 MarR family protein [Caproicibacter fermentans]OCN01179.1 hypothetical protein A7X67_07355 [Clostridium sp. W14A]QNK39597.1 MarR family transcriptional regulator [Caproicibacter fermentans]